MQKLEALVRSLGKLSLDLFNPFSHGIRFPLDEKSLAKARKMLEEALQPLKKSRISKFATDFLESRQQFIEIQDQNKNLSIAGRLFDHDIRNDLFPLMSAQEWFKVLSEEERMSREHLEPLLLRQMHIKLFASSIAYLASDGTDSEYLTWIPIDQLCSLVSGIIDPCVRCDTNNAYSTGKLRGDWYLCLHELVKNSMRYKYGDLQPNVLVHLHETRSKSNQLYLVSMVLDHGSGIMKPDQSPIPQKEMGKVLTGYTTRGSGVGCQAIRLLVDSANHHRDPELLKTGKYNICFITKVHDHDYMYYNKEDNISASSLKEIRELDLPDSACSPFIPSIDHGTAFSLYIPIDEPDAAKAHA